MKKKVFAILLCSTLFMGCSNAETVKLDGSPAKQEIGTQQSVNKVTYKVVGTYDETKVDSTVKKLENRAKVYSATAKITANKEDATITIELPDIKKREKVESIAGDITGIGEITFEDKDHNTLLSTDFIEEATTSKIKEGAEASSGDASVLDANYAIAFKFNQEGAKKFAEITKENLGNQISLCCDKSTILKATVHTVIVDGSIMLDGFSSKEEVDSIVTKVKDGMLDVKLESV